VKQFSPVKKKVIKQQPNIRFESKADVDEDESNALFIGEEQTVRIDSI
jgi:hypothetical protein